jgi:hypothetical protein
LPARQPDVWPEHVAAPDNVPFTSGQGESTVTDTKKPVDETGASARSDAPFPEKRRRRESRGKDVKATANAVRTKVASVVWLVAVVCALFLAVGAMLWALQANHDNSIVKFVLHGADALDGPFNPHNGVFHFAGKGDSTKNVLVNWGIAAVVYLVIGKILDRIIRP